MKQLFFAFSWLFLTVGVILTGIASYQFILFSKPQDVFSQTTAAVKISAAPIIPSPTPGDVKGVSTIIESDDARPAIIANFLKRYNSPLKPHDYYGEKLVEIADRHGIDFRLLPAIAMQESNLCKKIPEGSFNCLGFGVHSKGTLTFDSYEANFERAARELKKNYIDQGRTTPEEIMKKYTPGSNGSWALSVNQWMAEMRYNDRELGLERRTDADVLEFAEEANAIATPSPTPQPSSSPDVTSNEESDE